VRNATSPGCASVSGSVDAPDSVHAPVELVELVVLVTAVDEVDGSVRTSAPSSPLHAAATEATTSATRRSGSVRRTGPG
jgi:hypothetical protein